MTDRQPHLVDALAVRDGAVGLRGAVLGGSDIDAECPEHCASPASTKDGYLEAEHAFVQVACGSELADPDSEAVDANRPIRMCDLLGLSENRRIASFPFDDERRDVTPALPAREEKFPPDRPAVGTLPLH